MSNQKNITKWKSIIKPETIDWLLEEQNPSVRYFTLTELLDFSPDDAIVKKAKKAILTSGPVPVILSKQERGGYWGVPHDFYVRAKYKGTVWNIISLAQLGVDSGEKRARKAGEFILGASQDKLSGGFSYKPGKDGGDHESVIPCLTGNMVYSLIRFGFLDDPHVQRAIDWITKYQRFDDGEGHAPKGWLYDRYKQCWGKHTCMMGIVKILKALAEIPSEKRSEPVSAVIEKSAEYLLKHHLFKQSHNLNLIAKTEWTRFGFPLMWKTNALEKLEILTRLGYHDPRMQETVDLVLSRQNEQGRWLLETTFNGRTLVRIEELHKPSKFITFQALKTLKSWYTQ
jgi:hypothetical protein